MVLWSCRSSWCKFVTIADADTAVVATGTFVLNDVTETKVANITIKYVDYDSVVYATVDFEGTTGLGTSYASGTFNANEGISISYGGSRDEGD